MITFKKNETCQGDHYITGCLIDYHYFEKYYKLIAKGLSKERKLDADQNAIQQINFTGNLDEDGNATMFFIIEEAKRNHFRFFTNNCESIFNLFCLNITSI